MRSSSTLLLIPLLLLGLALPALASDSPGTVLITGANRGIGLALAREFSDAGYDVIGTARRPNESTALKALGARVEQLDVASQDSVDAMAKRLAGQPIDFLVNNAGIIGHDTRDFRELEVDKLEGVLNVNTLGPLRVMQALLPNVQASQRKVVANMSSMMGSMELNTWGCCLGYRASKAALNAVNTSLAIDYGKQGMTFVVLHPGYVRTDMNEGKGNITARQSAEGLMKVISGLDGQDNGKFYNYLGEAMPW